MKNLLTLLVLISVTLGCSPKFVVPELSGSSWKLTEWPGQEIPTSADGTLNFTTSKDVGGKSFCNGFGGTYTLNGENIKFSALMGTKMWCEQVGQAENTYLKMLGMADKVRIINGKLHLMKADSDLLIFTKTAKL